MAKAATQRDLARALGRSQQAVSKWVRDDRWPFGPRGPWDVAKVKAWAGNTLANDPAADKSPDSPLGQLRRRADVSLKITRQKLLQLQLELDQGKLHRSDECQRERCAQIREVKRQLLELPDALPIARDEKELVRSRIRAVLVRLSS